MFSLFGPRQFECGADRRAGGRAQRTRVSAVPGVSEPEPASLSCLWAPETRSHSLSVLVSEAAVRTGPSWTGRHRAQSS